MRCIKGGACRPFILSRRQEKHTISCVEKRIFLTETTTLKKPENFLKKS